MHLNSQDHSISLQCIFESNKQMLCFQMIVLTAKYINEGHLIHSEGLHCKRALKQNSHYILTRVLTISSRKARTQKCWVSQNSSSKPEDTVLLGASSLQLFFKYSLHCQCKNSESQANTSF